MSYIKQIVNGFIESELKIFNQYFNEPMVEDFQDTRSLSIAWVCYYFKPLIDAEIAKKIIDFTDKVYGMKNYRTHGWYRISAFEAAAFILTGDTAYANNLVCHIDCGQGWARQYIIQSAGIICPLLSFDNAKLRKATEKNLEYSHFFFEHNVVLYLCVNGSNEEKVDWFNNQLTTCKEHHKMFFNSLINPTCYYETSYFIDTFNKAKTYFIFKVISSPQLAFSQPGLFDYNELNFKNLWQMEKKHLLNSPFINFSFIKDNQHNSAPKEV